MKKTGFLLVALFLAGCNSATQTANEPKGEEPKTEPAQVAAQPQNAPVQKVDLKVTSMYKGTVRFQPMEGGFWGIETDSGKKILPSNLLAEHRKDGLRLSFNAVEVKDMMTIQQWGVLSTLSNVKVIGQVESRKSDPNI